jgi:hypothetical protein
MAILDRGLTVELRDTHPEIVCSDQGRWNHERVTDFGGGDDYGEYDDGPEPDYQPGDDEPPL